MTPIIPQSVYTKTARGILEVRNKTIKLPRELASVFLSVDGKSTVGDLLQRLGITAAQLHQSLNALVADGYVKMVHSSVQAPPDPARKEDVQFNPAHSVSKLNMEAASHALAEAEATKLAQNEGRAALDARLRAEAEARARTLAEMRAQAEAEARAKAEAAALVAAEARASAEQEARIASGPSARADATARARTAASAAIRAEAEARARSEAEARARAVVQEKKAAEEGAREAASAHQKTEEQAQARAVAEARAREALEAQIEAVTTLSAQTGNAGASEADAARMLLHQREDAAERARKAVQAAAVAQGATAAPAVAELKLDDLAHQLTARVHSERRARDEAGRQSRAAPPTVNDESGREIRDPSAYPALELMPEDGDVAAKTPRVERPSSSAGAANNNGLPTISLAPTTGAGEVKHTTPEHVPSALERAMMQTAARAQAEEDKKAKTAAAPPIAAAAPAAPQTAWAAPVTAPAADAGPTPAAGERIEPTLDDEPLNERLNVDRAAHDILAEAVDARRTAEVAELSRSAAAARRQRAEEDVRRAATALRERKRRQARTAIGIALVGVPALAIAWLQFVPMNSYVPEAQQALSERFNQPTTISTLRYVLLPTPRIVLEGVRIGNAQGIRVERVDAHAWPTEFFGGPMVFSTVDASGVDIDPGMLAAIPSWTGGRSANAVHVNRLRLSGVKLSIPPSSVEGLGGDVTFAANGTVKRAVLANDTVKLEITPQESGIRVVLNARDWRPPLGFPMNLSHLTLDGIADKQRFATTELSARIGGGSLTGTLAARWEGPMIVGGQFRLSGARLDEIMPAVAPALGMKGFLSANARYAMQADSATGILGKPLIEGTFAVTRGEVANIDLLRAVQSSGSTPVRGGRTTFDELKGSLQIAGAQYSYRNLQLSSGPLEATGYVDVAPGGQLSGRVNAELNARGSVIARSPLTFSGTLKDPRLTR